MLSSLILSCQQEEIEEPRDPSLFTENFQTRGNSRSALPAQAGSPGRNLKEVVLAPLENAECGATEFSDLLWKELTLLATDQLAVDHLELYQNLNYYAAVFGIGGEYFGGEGEYTHLIQKVKRDLEQFWDMPGEIRIHGQHTHTLNDPEALVEILWRLKADVASKEELYEQVEFYLQVNQLSTQLPESPFFAIDAFATTKDLIVLGDGLVALFSGTGIDQEVVWTSILAHEWAHQIQINFFDSWYSEDAFETEPEKARLLELEADFFAAYYLTHKRGATYNWKRVNDFLEVFYQAGDCSFDFEYHHGTPAQRQKAAYAGYLLTQEMQRKGHILSAEEVHLQFLMALPRILG